MPRMTVVMDATTARYFKKMAHERRTDLGGLIEQGVRVIQAAREQRTLGRTHLGFVSDPRKLDAELIIV